MPSAQAITSGPKGGSVCSGAVGCHPEAQLCSFAGAGHSRASVPPQPTLSPTSPTTAIALRIITPATGLTLTADSIDVHDDGHAGSAFDVGLVTAVLGSSLKH